jgi:starvation-inducible DNA-binding protein
VWWHIQCKFKEAGESRMEPNIGISADKRKEVCGGLARLLADSYSLYLKTHNFHWNVRGKMFQTLHLMFETQYTELALAVDLVAERIRSLGHIAPGSYGAFKELSKIPDGKGTETADEMIKQLVEGQETVIRTAREIFPVAESAVDEATCDLLTQRIQVHEKTAWMLRSLLD